MKIQLLIKKIIRRERPDLMDFFNLYFLKKI